MLITTTDNIEGYRIRKYLNIITVFQEDEWDQNIEYAMKALKQKAEVWMEDYMHEKDEYYFESEYALVGVHIVSASTYGQNDDGATKPDIIAYGTLVIIGEA